ncbi:MAG: bifunctional folylpolyglutamate synthase/dihydrofolate synthase [Rhodobacteraceae bacterium]|nr:bifunctional folylpolyglutamate synthase/dihydrofolate synthase [Paracoccaceae bacterium]
MQRLLSALGSPEKKLPPTIHIAGTNGKGSVTATMRAILEASGKSCHVYTSPHLVSFNERIRLGNTGRYVDDADLTRALLRCEEVNAGQNITFFEATTAAAFLLFAENPADVLLLEVGLGGRLDATNVVDDPLATVITPISLDHENYLGDQLADIAAEKAGIIKSGKPVVVAPQVDEVMAVIERTAARMKAPTYRFGQDFMATEDQGRLAFQDENGLEDLPLSCLSGAHQVINAGMAIATLKAADLWPKDPEVAASGLKSVDWPGRLQPLRSGPLVDQCPEGAEIWLDGGHNPGAGITVAAFMREQEVKDPKPFYMISGMLTTKDPVGFYKAFNGLARHVATVPISNTQLAHDPENLAGFVREAGVPAAAFSSLQEAIADVVKRAEGDDEAPRILICGSLYLVGDVLAANDMAPD